jgi:hypothetical protein
MTSSTFPSNSFILDALEAYFVDAGFDCTQLGVFDCEAVGSGGVRWLVEVVGGPVLDRQVFQQKLGWLLAHMEAGPETTYALAIPNAPDFVLECERIPRRVRQALNLWWCVVSDDSVVPVKPGKVLELPRASSVESG